MGRRSGDWRARFARRVSIPALSLLTLSTAYADADPAARSNVFNDPFVQASSGLPACPVPQGPLLTQAETRAQAHGRVERGTTCYEYGRCRLPNAYLYDAEIVPRVARFIARSERFANSSVWLLGQRRWVFLKGCVPSAAMARYLVHEVRLIDDVEAVIDELMVGTTGKPPYEVSRP